MLAVLNASARAGDSPAARRALAELAGGADLEVARTSSREELRAALEDLGGRRLVVMGGDGSVHAVVAALQEAGRLREVGPLGLVPLGTGNDLARSLGLPVTDPVAAARTALDGRARDVELLVEDGGSVVVNAVHAGIGVSATQRAHRAKPVLGRLAYPAGRSRPASRRARGSCASRWTARWSTTGATACCWSR